jgi:S1-C subfamily serine protease
MNRIIYFFFFLIITVFFVESLAAQVFVQKKGAREGEIFFLNEAAAMLKDEDGTIKVDVVLPGEQRPKEYQNIDLKQGDEILMVNAKRVKSVKELEKIYNELGVGGEMKLGVRRGEEMFLVSFNKIDPEKLPKRRFMIRKGEPGDLKPGEEKKIFSQQIKIENKDGKVKPVLEIGLILKEVDNKVIVDKVIADLAKREANFDAKEGDIIFSINGEKLQTVQQFSGIYDKIQTGQDVKFVVLREKKEMAVSFKKPEEEQTMIIKEK